MGMPWAAATLKTKEFSARCGQFRPKMCGHTTDDESLADGGIHGVAVGRRLEPAVGFDLRQSVERGLFHLLSKR